MNDAVLTFALALGSVCLGFLLRGPCCRSKSRLCATLYDLEKMENRITMKLSEIKAQVAEAAARSTEAFAELGTRIADLQKQIDDLIAAAQDPDVTDEAFLANLNTVKTNVAALADIVPNPE